MTALAQVLIVLRYLSVDGVDRTRRFNTLAGAQRFAQERVGATPEVSAPLGRVAGGSYAVSADGVGKIVILGGCTFADLFPALVEAPEAVEPLMPTKGARYEIALGDDLVETGAWTEDGEREIGRVLYLIARRTDGAQWAHDFSIRAFRGTVDREMARMVGLQRRVQAHVNAGRALDADHWVAIDPAYGSEAYQRLDAHGFFRDCEILRAVDQGERVDREVEDMARFNVGGLDRAEMA